jgi:tetratricopeptide (TPR) repeat protein
MLLPFDLLTFVTGTASANSNELIEYKLPQDSSKAPGESGNQIRLRLLKSEITAVKDGNEPKVKIDLNRLIEQIRAVEIRPQQVTEIVASPVSVPTTEPNNTTVNITVPKEEEKKEDNEEIEPKPKHTSITEETLKTLRSLTQNPEKIENCFELGEILFVNGNLKEAVVFYQEALTCTDPNDPARADDRAWLLFQIGNCMRNEDMDEAGKTYKQLIMEYPNSLWSELAQVQSQFIAWYQTNEPQNLISENEN